MADFEAQLERIVAELMSGLLAVTRIAELQQRHRKLRALQKAIEWQRELDTGRVASAAAIARREGLPQSSVTQSMRLLDELEGGDEPASRGAPLAPGSANHFPARAKPGGRVPDYRELRRAMLLRFDTGYISELLAAAGNNVSLAAKMARIDRKHLWRLIQRTRIRSGRRSRR